MNFHFRFPISTSLFSSLINICFGFNYIVLVIIIINLINSAIQNLSEIIITLCLLFCTTPTIREYFWAASFFNSYVYSI